MNTHGLLKTLPALPRLLSAGIPGTYLAELARAYRLTLQKHPDALSRWPAETLQRLPDFPERMRLIDGCCHLFTGRIMSSVPTLALEVGHHLSVLSHGPLGEASLTAARPRDVLQLWQEHLPRLLPFIDLALTDEDAFQGLEIRTLIPVLIYRRDLHELIASALLRALRDCARHLGPEQLRLEVNWPRPGHWREYRRILNVDCVFDAPALRVLVVDTAANRPLPLANAAANEAALARLGSGVPAGNTLTSMHHRVAAWLARQPGNLPSQADTARHFHVSTRALRSRLRRDGTSYQDIKTAIQLCRAMGLLAQTDLPLGEVAERAGFTSSPSLSRAFRQWHGMSPSQFRRQLQAPKSH